MKIPILGLSIVFAILGLAIPLGVYHALSTGHSQPAPATTRPAPATTPSTTQAAAVVESDVLHLFDGKTLTHWKASEFGGEGEVEVKDGAITIAMGATLSGITWTGKPLPKIDYEINFDAMKTQGSDFFVGLTFPVNESHASLILGGWGGMLVGISSINGFDASENETTAQKDFKKNQWYHIRMIVTADNLQAYIDAEKIVDVDIKEKKVGTRADIDAAKPFGISNFQTATSIKNLTVKPIKP